MNALRDAVRRLRPADVAGVLRANGLKEGARHPVGERGRAAVLFWPSGIGCGRTVPLAPGAPPLWPLGELRLPSALPPLGDWPLPPLPPAIESPLPPSPSKQAARLIVIRRRKMKKHQRRKLWKRMRHRWARVKQRRRQTKEKIFQNELLALMKKADEFSASRHVEEQLRKANHSPLPTRWRHKRLPEFIIRQLMGIDKKINYKHSDVYKA